MDRYAHQRLATRVATLQIRVDKLHSAFDEIWRCLYPDPMNHWQTPDQVALRVCTELRRLQKNTPTQDATSRDGVVE